MVLKGTTKLLVSRTKIKGKRGRVREYERFLIHIPSKIAKDSQFPFEAGQVLSIEVIPKGRKTVLSASQVKTGDRRNRAGSDRE